jgi:hypothetical protein
MLRATTIPAPTTRARAAATAAPGAMPPRVAAVPADPFQRARKLHELIAQLTARTLENQAATAALLPLRGDAGTWDEWFAIQRAVLERIGRQQDAWYDGWAGLAEEYAELRNANTVAKYVEQEYNLASGWTALLFATTAGWAALVENVQVDYGYWLHRKLAQPEARVATGD